MHLAGHCVCGRGIHLPWNAGYGYTWVCRKCGRDYVLKRDGHKQHPLARVGSRKPAVNPFIPPHVAKSSLAPRHSEPEITNGAKLTVLAVVVIIILILFRS